MSQHHGNPAASSQPPTKPKRRRPRRGSSEAVLECFGRWVGDAEELDRLTAEVQRMRDESIEEVVRQAE